MHLVAFATNAQTPSPACALAPAQHGPRTPLWVRLAWPTAIDRQIAIFCVTSCTNYSYPIATLSDDFEKGASGQNK